MLNVKENIHSRSILTSRGMTLENKVSPYDVVYEYDTGNWIQVKNVKRIQINDLYVIKYSDGREQFISDSEKIMIGDKVYTIEDIKLNKVKRKPQKSILNF